MCRQARERGLLRGDLNAVQSIALVIAQKFEFSFELQKMKSDAEHLNSLFDAWLAVTNPDVYSAVTEVRHKKQDEETHIEFAEVGEDDMKPLIAKMKRLAAMERAKAKG